MSDEKGNPSLQRLLDQLRFVLSQPIDFDSSDPSTLPAKVRLLTAAASYFNLMALSDFGGRVGPEREPGLTEQVIAAAFQTFEGFDPHPSAFEKAAMLIRGIIQGHPFHDANKRTGFLTATYYLQLVHVPLPDEFDAAEMERLAVEVSAGRMRDISEIAGALQQLWTNS